MVLSSLPFREFLCLLKLLFFKRLVAVIGGVWLLSGGRDNGRSEYDLNRNGRSKDRVGATYLTGP